jgi:hypothetical protein
MVGISLATTVPGANVLLTDLGEAQEIVERNINLAQFAKGASVTFQELNWDEALPAALRYKSSVLDLVVAADCTYNPDSRYSIRCYTSTVLLITLQSSTSRYAQAVGQYLTPSQSSHCDEDAAFERRGVL